ncbi:hypothetical protein BCR33DRAFT_169482 [Rhizoclosmatium globosum]|uniref:Uncharacterized protein n=1 Tax=Rhizoclosmatium globosum TaxID=329046 RepID=A0A1Y2CEN5_9FUNG|nr:hypothetical protein BCR33DRAFT_169482 [Rhizoclosmatium globosum]|eukprot:ORY45509.1 hypothetical protein BCR33DRAFT_169482 [Rhizoclosmatium globosum]
MERLSAMLARKEQEILVEKERAAAAGQEVSTLELKMRVQQKLHEQRQIEAATNQTTLASSNPAPAPALIREKSLGFLSQRIAAAAERSAKAKALQRQSTQNHVDLARKPSIDSFISRSNDDVLVTHSAIDRMRRDSNAGLAKALALEGDDRSYPSSMPSILPRSDSKVNLDLAVSGVVVPSRSTSIAPFNLPMPLKPPRHSKPPKSSSENSSASMQLPKESILDSRIDSPLPLDYDPPSPSSTSATISSTLVLPHQRRSCLDSYNHIKSQRMLFIPVFRLPSNHKTV